MSDTHPHPFDLDDRIVLTRPAWFHGERISATFEPTDFDDPVMVVESLAYDSGAPVMEVTAANGETYEIADLAAFRMATSDEAAKVGE